MKTPLRLAAAIAAVLLLTSCSSTAESSPNTSASAPPDAVEVVETAAAVESLPFNASGLLNGTAAPNFEDGEPGEVSVVQVGPLDKPGVGALLLFGFRNNTAAAVAHVDWTATARSGGAIVSTGSSQGTVPAVIQPGEVGLAYIYFDNGEVIPDDAEYEFSASTSAADTSPYNTAAIKVTEVNLSGDAIVGAATNDTGADTVGPYSVNVFCFDGDTIVSQHQGFAEQDELPGGATATFTVSLFGATCPSYAVGVSGYFS